MKQGREDQRRVTLRLRHDGATGRATLVIDVEVPEDDLPHEHRQELREMAEEVLGVPLSALGDDVEVALRRAGGHAHPHPDGGHAHPPEAEGTAGRAAVKQGS